MINEIVERFKNYPDFFVTTFSQIGVGDMEKFRKSLKKASAVYMIVKNSMVVRAIEESGRGINLLEEIKPLISGSCGILFSKDNPAVIARSLVNFSRGHEHLKIQGGFLNGERVSSDTIKVLAALPPRDVLLAMVASGIKAPISGFVGLLGNLLRNLVGVIEAISKKKSE